MTDRPAELSSDKAIEAPLSSMPRRLDRAPPRVRAILLAIWFAYNSWTFTWGTHPVAYEFWTLEAKLRVAFWVSVPLIAGGLWLMVRANHRIDRLAPLVLAAHAIAGIFAIGAIGNRSLFVVTFAVASVCITMPAVFILSTRRNDWKALRPYLELICGAIVAPALVLLIWSPLNILVVRYAASAVASGAPFCIQSQSDYLGRQQQVTRWSRLAGLQMQAPWTNGGGSQHYQFAFHALLVVERNGAEEFYNWSYFGQTFRRVSDQANRALHLNRDCDPVPDFFSTLQP